MTEYQCCTACNTPKWIFTTKNNSLIAVCNTCYSREELRETCKGAWNIETGDYSDFNKLEVAS